MKRKLDARGLSCPLPVLEARKALREMEAGQLEVLVDNGIAVQNLEKMAAQLGLDCESSALGEDQYAVLITVGPGSPGAQRGAPSTAPDTVVVLASDEMGAGDPELGRLLMKSFIYTLTELEVPPAKVLLYNSGVKLAVQGSDTLADLLKLAERGVEILACGTCLNYYQLTDQLGVGAVTNMYAILESQMAAGKIVRP
ncbi:MAG TPA: sulfurtransferase-like selenium metabolism protein YedF [Limnochordia bacterium]|jgi:selenium metabolism protein YedF|nr:sulfurtransferase-like selenium metabolism protein YedF [Limnochordia bacterium]